MINKRRLDSSLVLVLYACIATTTLLYFIAIETSHGIVLYITMPLVPLIFGLIPTSIVYNLYLSFKSFSVRQVFLLLASLISISWVVLGIYYIAGVLGNFNQNF